MSGISAATYNFELNRDYQVSLPDHTLTIINRTQAVVRGTLSRIGYGELTISNGSNLIFPLTVRSIEIFQGQNGQFDFVCGTIPSEPGRFVAGG